MTRKAILQVADTGPLESLVVMLRAVGYECYLPDEQVRRQMTNAGCDTVLDVKGLVDRMGYEYPFRLPTCELVSLKDMDVFVDIKAHRNYGPITRLWPWFKNKVLWYRINGGEPEHVIRADGFDCGDEIKPPCPVLTPNQWYALQERRDSDGQRFESGWKGISYACWPPFYRFDEYYDRLGRDKLAVHKNPICLIHNLQGWGYEALIPNLRKLGIKMYGAGSPNGCISHEMIPSFLRSAKCMVHLKSSDAPGYALYEALAAACPIVCTRRLIWRNRMQDLLIPGETCLVFDRETHEGLSAEDVLSCTKEVEAALAQLSDPAENIRIGMAGHDRLKQLMWSEGRGVDVDSLSNFMERMFHESGR